MTNSFDRRLSRFVAELDRYDGCLLSPDEIERARINIDRLKAFAEDGHLAWRVRNAPNKPYILLRTWRASGLRRTFANRGIGSRGIKRRAE